MRDESLRARLLAMIAEDRAVRARLAADSLYNGYHPEMEAVHVRNVERLFEIIATHGWPDRDQAEPDGTEAAFLILQHAISRPAYQRKGLRLLMSASPGKVDPRHVAMLEDRIRFFEGRPQLYGTAFDWDADGELSPAPIEDPARVDERRRRVGLAPLAEEIRRQRAAAAAGGEKPSADFAERRRRMEAWARAVGWRG